ERDGAGVLADGGAEPFGQADVLGDQRQGEVGLGAGLLQGAVGVDDGGHVRRQVGGRAAGEVEHLGLGPGGGHGRDCRENPYTVLRTPYSVSRDGGPHPMIVSTGHRGLGATAIMNVDGTYLLLLLAMPPVFYASAFLHEVGHAVLAHLCGFEVTSFGMGLGKPLWVGRWGRTLVYFCRVKLFQGITFSFSPRIFPGRWQVVGMLAGGIP